jgi:hypothetical protein
MRADDGVGCGMMVDLLIVTNTINIAMFTSIVAAITTSSNSSSSTTTTPTQTHHSPRFLKQYPQILAWKNKIIQITNDSNQKKNTT